MHSTNRGPILENIRQNSMFELCTIVLETELNNIKVAQDVNVVLRSYNLARIKEKTHFLLRLGSIIM